MDPSLPIPSEKFYSNIPKTPRKAGSSSLPKNDSTPIFNKTSGLHTYASQVDLRDVQNEALALEMNKRFVGPMPLEAFFLSVLKVKIPKTDINLLPFKEVAEEAKDENDMREKFIKAMKVLLPETLAGWQFVNSANKRDILHDRLSPDVPIYGPDAPSDMEKPDSSRMESFIEFKFKASADPFIDNPRVKEEDPTTSGKGRPAPGKGALFEHDSIEATSNRGQLGSYVAAIAGSQFRLRVFCVFIFGSFARLMCWDRAAAVVTEKFNYTDEPYLAQFFLSYCSSLTREAQGHDPTVRALNAKELEDVNKLNCLNDLSNLNHHHREFRLMKIPDRDLATEHDFLISYPPKYSYRSPFGRATRPMRAYDMRKKKVVFVKDYWRPDSLEIDKEGDIYLALERAQVPYIAPFGVGNDVREFKTHIHRYREHVWACDTVKFSGLILYRMSLEKLGHNLVEFESTYDLVKVISHAMTAHDVAFHKANILHRDISVGNILIDDEGDGFLIDWDLCIRTDKASFARRSQRTGTWQFISAALLRDPKRVQTNEDDRESAVHVLIWVALRYAKHNGLQDIGVHLEPYDEVYHISTTGTSMGGVHKGDRLSSKLFPKFESDPLNQLIDTLRRTFSARYEIWEYSAEEIKEARDFVDVQGNNLKQHLIPPAYVYGARLDSLMKPGWLVEVFNEHLEADDWPDNDMGKANLLLTSNVSSQKRTSQQAILEERALGSMSKRKLG